MDGAKIRLWGDLLCKKGHDPYMVDVLRDSRLGCTVSASSPSFVCCVCVCRGVLGAGRALPERGGAKMRHVGDSLFTKGA